MTVASETSRSGPYNGNDVTTSFDYAFRIRDETHISVIQTDALGVETTLTLTTDYTVTGVGDATGQVVLVTALPTGETLLNLRDVPFTQEIDLENQGAYYAQTVEDGLDLAAMRAQQLQEQIDRAVLIPASSDPNALVGLIEDIIRLSDSVANVDTVAGIAANVTTVAGIDTDVTAVAAIDTDVTAVAAIEADVTTVAGIEAAVVAAPTHAANAATSETNAGLSEIAAAASAASIVPANFLRKDDNLASVVDPAAAAASLGLEIGVDVEAFDAATAKTDAAQAFTAPQRGTPDTDNDLSFNLGAKNNFVCTLAAGGALTFTGLVAGQSGNIDLTNGAAYAITAAAGTIISSSDLTTISLTGRYWLSYYCSNGTDVLVTASQDCSA